MSIPTDDESVREHFKTYFFVHAVWRSINPGGNSAEFVDWWKRTTPAQQKGLGER